jgi:hypothetical protein
VPAGIAGIDGKRRDGGLLGDAHKKRATLHAFARGHLIAKAEAGLATDGWLDQAEMYLEGATGYFGAERDLATSRWRTCGPGSHTFRRRHRRRAER